MENKKERIILWESLNGKTLTPIQIYCELLNFNYHDEDNRIKNVIEEDIDLGLKGLKFGWTIKKVTYERLGVINSPRIIAYREYGCRGSYGFSIIDSYNGEDCNIAYIDLRPNTEWQKGGYVFNTNECLGYEMTNIHLLNDYVKIMNGIKNIKKELN